MVAGISTAYVAKGVALWIMTMLPTLLTLVTRDFTINIILLVVLFPIMLSYLSKMGTFQIKTAVIGIAAAITFFVLYIISKAFPKIQNAMANPGENRTTTIIVIVLISSIFALAMGGASMFVPMYDIEANVTSAAATAAPMVSPHYNNYALPNIR